jgi:hypothetical protein
MVAWETKQVLVTVKAYPQDSKRYSETVCTAGICLDDKKWIRLYPIPFRFLDGSKQFSKYQIIDVEVSRDGTDGRPESHKVRQDTLTPGRLIDSAKNWQKRKEYVLPTLSRSMCEIMREQESTKKSLGAFKLTRPTKFYWKKVDISAEEEPEHIQLVLFDSQKKGSSRNRVGNFT